ncbi:MAG: hypothetical protein ABSC08_16670 [Bryobacteraceae bacterium]|jgi:hypothetical protein
MFIRFTSTRPTGIHGSRPWFLIATLFAVLTGTAVAQGVAANIDATRTAPPITKWVFGGFMEPATTRVWAEMLYDRTFLNEVNSILRQARALAGRRELLRQAG